MARSILSCIFDFDWGKAYDNETEKLDGLRTGCRVFGSFLSDVCVSSKGEYSDSERRKLAAPPELSADTIFNGRFMSESETYVQDHFPFRDQFRTLKALSAACLFQRKDNNGIYVI